jgi:hypothetical protein
VSWKDVLTLIGVGIELGSVIFYIWTILKGSTRPQPISWAGWTAIGAVGAWAARSGGAGLSFYIAAAFVAVTGSVLIVSLIPGYGHSGTDDPEPTDLPILIAGVILLVLRALGVFPPSLHATLAVLGDSCFAWFTLRKAARYPETEAFWPWAGAVVAAGLGLVVLGSFNYTAMAYPVYLFVANTAITGAILIGRSRKPKRNKSRG